MASGGGTAALDIACLEALGEVIAAVVSEAAPPVAAAGATAAVGAGAYLAASWAMQDNGPVVPPIQPERLPDDGFTVTIPVPNSSTVTSGVPLGIGSDTSTPGIAPVSLPSPSIVEPLPDPGTVGNNIVNNKTLQTGGHTLSNQTLKGLGLTKEQGKRAVEALKKAERLPNNFHPKIMANGDYVDAHTGEVKGNLYDYVD